MPCAQPQARLCAYLRGLHIRCPRHTGGAPLPDAKRDDASQSGRDAGRAGDLDLSIDQFGGITATLEVLVRLDVMQIGVRHDKGDSQTYMPSSM